MANSVFPKVQHDWLKHELDPNLFRRGSVVASGAGALVSGQVLGKITASGKYVPVAPAAVDGSEAAAAILIDAVDATSADVDAAVLIGHAQIVTNQLTWTSGMTTNQKNTAVSQLVALNIVDLQRL